LQNSGVNVAKGEEASQMSNFQNYRICNALQNLQPIFVANIELASSPKRCANKLGCFIYNVLHEKI
jgi:hypothetical protein